MSIRNNVSFLYNWCLDTVIMSVNRASYLTNQQTPPEGNTSHYFRRLYPCIIRDIQVQWVVM